MPSDDPKELLEVALHPVRMRILMLLSGTPGLTPQQMAERMSDVPQATLYRHINRLARAGLLVVTAERPVRGTLEKVFALNTAGKAEPASAQEALDALKRLSKADHLRYFTAFTMTLLDDFSRYLEGGEPDLVRDGVGYHKLAFFLSDEEFAAFAVALNQALVPFLNLEATPERRKRLFATTMMPSADRGEPLEPPESK
jgi:DNA-binding transcriptional ArsR family regulator